MRLDPDLPSVPRHSLDVVQFGHRAERIILLDVILRVPLRAQFQIDAVDALDPHTVAMKDGWLLGRRRLRFEKRRELGVRGVGRALRQVERAGKDLSAVAVSGLGQIIGQ